MLQEYAVLPNSTVPNTMNMEFNWLTFNGKAGPAQHAADRSSRRVAFASASSIWGWITIRCICTGTPFYVTGTEGGRIPETTWRRGNTTLVGVAQARDIEFVANNPGRLDAPLPSPAPHDEPDVLQCRSHDALTPWYARREST